MSKHCKDKGDTQPGGHQDRNTVIFRCLADGEHHAHETPWSLRPRHSLRKDSCGLDHTSMSQLPPAALQRALLLQPRGYLKLQLRE